MILSIVALVTLSTLAPARQSQTSDEPFPTSTALAEGVSPQALEELGALVQQLVDDGEIVGGELLVLKNGKALLYEAYGWSDREAELPMRTDSVFCVRSMTKPFISASILMLADEKALKLGDRASQYLPAFDVDGLREITIDQLLHHTGGLTMSLLLGRDLKQLEGIQAVAALATETEFAPGTRFHYSDQGTDTLTAIVEVASGMSAADFVRTRLLEPLGMRDSACVMSEGHPLRERGCCKYFGTRGSWTRFWSPADAPLFPFFLGSQGLYSTTLDYARFMQFWMDRGRVGRERLLKSSSVRRALEPGPFPFEAPTGFADLRVDYGALMQLWTGEGEDGEREVVAFGHTGSDGTHAWAFPEQDAMALFFTQSRNNTTGLQVEEALGRLFLGAPFDPNELAPPFDDYLGYYFEGEGDLYRAIVRDGDSLTLEIMGKGLVPLSYAGGDRWKFRPNPGVVIEFDRADDGVVTGYHIGDHVEFRFEPREELPTGAEVAELVAKTHRLDLLESVGPLRIHSAIEFEKLGLEGEILSLLAAPNRYRFDSTVGEEVEHMAFDGERVWYSSRATPAGVIDGPRADSLRLSTPAARFGDWREWYPELTVIQSLSRAGETILVVRAGSTSAPGTTLYVHAETGRLVAVDELVYADGMGLIGQHTELGDFRDVGGILFPYRSETELANPLIGTIVSTVQEIERGVELEDDAFEL